MKRPALLALMAHFGSLRHTLVLVALLAAVVLLKPAWWPLALVVGVGVGRLTALDGRFELTQGEPFDGSLLDRDAGALHVERLAELSFRHDGFEIDYAPGRKRGATRNAVTWHGADGQPRSAVIGDHHPLVLDGHRFYTSPNKGYAPMVRWVPEQGQPVLGAVHLPSFPAQELQQSREWALPDGRMAWVLLQWDETLIDPARATRFAMPRAPRLVVRVDHKRAELAPGQGLDLPGGRLVFEELRTWMGYRVAYDPTLPWLLVAALLSALALAVHYALKFTSRRAAVPRALAGAVDG